MKLALVHDHLTQVGGAEKVLLALRATYPQAPIYTLVYDAERLGDTFPKDNVQTSSLQQVPGGVRHYQWFLPLMPWATEQHDLRTYDVVISSSSAFAKGVITGERAVHLCYCHTPTRYLWSDAQTYVAELPYPRFIRALIPPLLTRLRGWDYLAAQRPDLLIANSRVVQRRIRKYYRRESEVLYPPVAVAQFHPTDDPGGYFLTGGRLVSYKRFDIVVEAFNRLRVPLAVFGEGPARRRLERLAKRNVTFLGRCADGTLARMYARCRAFIHPQEEDFGITAVEAMAAGRPVIAFQKGGASETVLAGETGSFFDEQSWEAVAEAVIRFSAADYSSTRIRAHAEAFSPEVFRAGVRRFVARAVAGEFSKVSQ